MQEWMGHFDQAEEDRLGFGMHHHHRTSLFLGLVSSLLPWRLSHFIHTNHVQPTPQRFVCRWPLWPPRQQACTTN